jgi:polar amino acid transport system substrate-binding protein
MSPSRRYAYFFLIAVLTGALALAAGCLSEPEDTSGDLTGPTTPAALTYYTEDLPPYNYLENGTLQGIAVDLLEAIT